jgi:hypothetical protein
MAGSQYYLQQYSMVNFNCWDAASGVIYLTKPTSKRGAKNRVFHSLLLILAFYYSHYATVKHATVKRALKRQLNSVLVYLFY